MFYVLEEKLILLEYLCVEKSRKKENNYVFGILPNHT